MLNKILTVLRLMHTETRNEKLKKQSYYILVFAELTIILVMSLLAILEFKKGSMRIRRDVLLLIATYSSALLVTVIFKKTYISSIIISLTMLVVFPATFYNNFNDGVGGVWFFMMPTLCMYVEGYAIGFWTAFAYWVIITFLFVNPETQATFLMNHDAGSIIRYIMVYTVDFIVSAVGMYKFHVMHLRQNNYMEELASAVKSERDKVSSLSMQTILSINKLVEAKDKYTGKHSQRVAFFSCLIAEKLGWSQEKIDELRTIALLHDIGKIGINEDILNKPARLNDDEYLQMKNHTVIGSEILKDLTLISNVALGAKHHHERFDGSGYPTGIKGDEIPIEARIICIADSFDAMAFSRIYRQKCDLDYIKSELIKGKGSQFDPSLIDAFIGICDEHNWFENFDIFE